MEKYLKINVIFSEELVKDLKNFGYEIRAGSASYKRDTLSIIPAKKWFWRTSEDLGTTNISL